MGRIHIGRQCYKDKDLIAQIVSLDHTPDKTFLRVAQEKGKVDALFGRQHCGKIASYYKGRVRTPIGECDA